ncbi:MAG: hypothetical protein KC708_26950, partial [Anaerolineae bacterium]|nr:hypothetical protein [Anaerolineae bacterium]
CLRKTFKHSRMYTFGHLAARRTEMPLSRRRKKVDGTGADKPAGDYANDNGLRTTILPAS